MDDDLRARARVHAALAEPHRLAIVDELARSDLSPTELCERLDLPTNLLAHHLDVLEAAGLLERVVSAGDRRRRYLRLCPRPVAGAAADTTPVVGPVLFVCTQNSARSQLAAAIWTRHRGDPAASAGTHPADRVHPGAMAAARRAGLDLESAVPTMLPDAVDAATVVTVCDRAHEELRPPASWRHWSIPDPVETATPASFDAAIADLDTRIRTLT